MSLAEQTDSTDLRATACLGRRCSTTGGAAGRSRAVREARAPAVRATRRDRTGGHGRREVRPGADPVAPTPRADSVPSPEEPDAPTPERSGSGRRTPIGETAPAASDGGATRLADEMLAPSRRPSQRHPNPSASQPRSGADAQAARSEPPAPRPRRDLLPTATRPTNLDDLDDAPPKRNRSAAGSIAERRRRRTCAAQRTSPQGPPRHRPIRPT